MHNPHIQLFYIDNLPGPQSGFVCRAIHAVRETPQFYCFTDEDMVRLRAAWILGLGKRGVRKDMEEICPTQVMAWQRTTWWHLRDEEAHETLSYALHQAEQGVDTVDRWYTVLPPWAWEDCE